MHSSILSPMPLAWGVQWPCFVACAFYGFYAGQLTNSLQSPRSAEWPHHHQLHFRCRSRHGFCTHTAHCLQLALTLRSVWCLVDDAILTWVVPRELINVWPDVARHHWSVDSFLDCGKSRLDSTSTSDCEYCTLDWCDFMCIPHTDTDMFHAFWVFWLYVAGSWCKEFCSRVTEHLWKPQPDLHALFGQCYGKTQS